MSKGAQAMAVAMIYPEPAKLKRPGSSKIEDQKLVHPGTLSQARKVLAHLPKIAAGVLAGSISLQSAYPRKGLWPLRS
jgi:hypothetical protein